MADNVQLTQGGVRAMYTSSVQPGVQPVVQIIDIKKVQSPGNNLERYRLIISDGVHYQQAMLGTQQNYLVKDENLQNNSIVRLTDHICNTVNNRRIIIILNLEIVAQNAQSIGNPKNIETEMQGQQVQPVPQYNNQQQNNFNNQQQNNFNNQPQNNFNNRQQTNKPQQNFNQNFNNTPRSAQPKVLNTPISKSPNPEDISNNPLHPVNSLNPYQNRWTIYVRVTSKGEKKTYENQRTRETGKPGQLFSFDVVDRERGELRITMFNEIVDLFYPHIQKGQCYFISRGQLKLANKKFTSIKNEYELTLDGNSIVQPAEDDGSIGGVQYQFTPIGEIQNKNKGDTVDVLAVVRHADPLTSVDIKSRPGDTANKRNIKLVDRDAKSIDLTLWDKFALSVSDEELAAHPVVAIKGAKVSDFNNRSLNSVGSTTIDWAPYSIPQAAELRTWYDNNGLNMSDNDFDAITQSGRFGGGGFGAGGGSGANANVPFKTFAQVKDDGAQQAADRFKARGTVTLIRHDGNISYKACPNAKCNRKVTFEQGQWSCASCGPVPHAEDRYILSLTASDYTGSLWLSAFNESGLILLDKRGAKDLPDPKENPAEFDRIFNDAAFKMYNFRIRAKVETYQSEDRKKCSIEALYPVNFVEEGNNLLKEIRAYM